MKRFKLLMIGFFFIPVIGFSQELTGMWTGVLNTDSNRVRKDKSFEIALTEYRGKVYGYTHSEFMVDDTLYYILKRVKGTVEGDSCVVTDDKIISCNFFSRLDKGVKQSYTFHLDKVDSVWHLDGKWKTELETKRAKRNFYAVGGSVKMAEEKDLTKSKIFPHLQELNLMNDIAAIESKNKNISNKQENPSPVIAKANPNKEKQPINNIGKEDKNAGSSKEDIAKANVKNPTPANNKKEELTTPAVSVVTLKKDNAGSSKEDIAKKNVKNPTPANNKKEELTTPAVSVVTPKKDEEQPKVNNKENKPVETNKADIAKLNVKSTITENDTIKISGSNVESSKQIAATSDSKKQKEQAGAAHKQNNKPETSGPVIAKSDTKNNEQKRDESNTTEAGHETSLPVVKTNPANEKETPVNKSEDNQSIKTEPVLTKSQSRREKRQQEKQARNEASTAETNISSINKTGNDNPVAHIAVPAADAAKRDVLLQRQTINFKNDSLELALYDNGEIDGDTVSVLLNGKLIMANVGLKATAVRKTIYIEPGQDSLEMVFYAENLGLYPPNTGLLIIHDGEDRYQVNFSSDLQRSAGVILRRKKN